MQRHGDETNRFPLMFYSLKYYVISLGITYVPSFGSDATTIEKREVYIFSFGFWNIP